MTVKRCVRCHRRVTRQRFGWVHLNPLVRHQAITSKRLARHIEKLEQGLGLSFVVDGEVRQVS